MRMSVRVSGLVMLCVISLALPPASACTIFTASKGDTVFFAGNEDQRPNEAYLFVDTSGSYGVVYIGTSWANWDMVMQTGINERGLSFDSNWIPLEALNPHPERGTPGEWVVTHILKECSTVEEALDTAFMFDWGESMEYQVHFADATGDAAVIHPGADGEIAYTRKSEGDGYLVSTNFNLVRLETGDYSCRRYDTASEMLSGLGLGEDFTVEFAASVLDATHQEGGVSTIYSTVYDLSGGIAYLYYDHRFDEPVVLDVAAELERGDRQVNIDELLPGGQETLVARLLAQPLVVMVVLGSFVLAGFYSLRFYRGLGREKNISQVY